MHELSVALSILDIAKNTAEKAKAKKITEIELDIGLLAGIEFEALNSAFEIAIQGTIAENAAQKINKIPGTAKCNKCNSQFEISSYFFECPDCKSYDTEIIQGQELKVKTISVE
ncbi:MAG: hydrogenase maturation nickel metallochaperone HypA [Ignavibacteria bacterium]|jgi:hydrogenase nickel incorporation protein HypA/HybF